VTENSTRDEVGSRKRAEFTEVVKTSLSELLGESTAVAILHHLGGASACRDPRVFEERLRALLGPGAEIVLKHLNSKLKASSET
jgi:hypothetical protein